jgi:hypothetical protein
MILVIEISTDMEEIQIVQAGHALEEFVKILVKEYPLVFKDGSGSIEIGPAIKKGFFPYEASIKITKKE